jgi:hypothetical protein
MSITDQSFGRLSHDELQGVFDYLLPKMNTIHKTDTRRYFWHPLSGHLFRADVWGDQLVLDVYLGCSTDENEARRICCE